MANTPDCSDGGAWKKVGTVPLIRTLGKTEDVTVRHKLSQYVTNCHLSQELGL